MDLCNQLPTKEEIIKYIFGDGDLPVKVAWYQDTSEEEEFSAPIVEVLEANTETKKGKKNLLTWVDADRLLVEKDNKNGNSVVEGLKKGIMPWGIPDPFTVADILRVRNNCAIDNAPKVAKHYLQEVAQPILRVLVGDDTLKVFVKGTNMRDLVNTVLDEDSDTPSNKQRDAYSGALMSLRLLTEGWVARNADYLADLHRDLEEASFPSDAEMEDEVGDLLETLTGYYHQL